MFSEPEFVIQFVFVPSNFLFKFVYNYLNSSLFYVNSLINSQEVVGLTESIL